MSEVCRSQELIRKQIIELNELFDKGEIEGLLVICQRPKSEFIVNIVGMLELSFVGLMEQAKLDFLAHRRDKREKNEKENN